MSARSKSQGAGRDRLTESLQRSRGNPQTANPRIVRAGRIGPVILVLALFIAAAAGFPWHEMTASARDASSSALAIGFPQHEMPASERDTSFSPLAPTTCVDRAFVSNFGSSSVSVIDPGSSNPVATIPVLSNPGGVAVNSSVNRAYVTDIASGGVGNISVIDTTNNTVVGNLAAGPNPHSVAVNGNSLYVTNSSQTPGLSIITLPGGARTAVGAGAHPFDVAVNPITQRVYVTDLASENGSYLLLVFNLSGSMLATPAVGTQPEGVAVDTVHNLVYVANSGANSVSVVNGATNTVIGTPIAVGSAPQGVAVSPTGKVYVTNRLSNNVSVIDPSHNNLIVATVNVGTNPIGVAVNSDGSRVYVTNAGSNNVSVIDGILDTPLPNVTVGSSPQGDGLFVGCVNPVTTPTPRPTPTPFANDDSYSTVQGTPLTVPAPGVPGILDNDTSGTGSPLSAILVNSPTHGGFGALGLLASGAFTYTPDPGFVGQDTFTYVANDGNANSVPATVTINVTPGSTPTPTPNTPPLAVNDSYTGIEDSSLDVLAPGVLGNDTDAERDALTSVLVTTTSNGKLVFHSDGSFSYSPNGNFVGSDRFTYRANDGKADSNIAAVTINVTAVNDPPLNIVPGAQSTNQDTALVFSTASGNRIAVSDVDDADDGVPGNETMQATLSVVNGTLTLNGTNGLIFTSGSGTADTMMIFTGTLADINAALDGLTYVPAPNFNGDAPFTITVNDLGNFGTGGALTDSDTVDITVVLIPPTPTPTPQNHAPVAANDSYSTSEDTQLNVSAPGVIGNDSDADSDPLTATLVSGPANAASFSLNADGSFSYAPAVHFVGTDSFTYTVSDGHLDSNIATVKITVNPVNHAPVIAGATIVRQQGQVGSSSVIANVSVLDAPAGSLIVTTTNVPTGISVTGITNADGQVTAVVAAGCISPGNYSIGLSVSDGNLASSGTLTVTVELGPDTDGDGRSDACDNCPTTPNPEKILFVSNRDGNHEIYVSNSDGTDPRRLTNNNAEDIEPSFSPDGSKIVFASSRDGFQTEIYIMNPDGSNQTRLTHNFAIDAEPSFSPDGSKIIFSSNRDGNSQVYIMNRDGSNQTNLTNSLSNESRPRFSPDGSKIVFVSDRDGNFEIYVMNANGAQQMRLTSNAATDFDPAFSPDGSKIAFSSNRDGNYEIYVMNSDGSAQTNITNDSSTDVTPSFSPDGLRITFSSSREGNGNIEIFVMNADGLNPVRLTNDPSEDSDPSWGSQADSDCDGVPDFRDNCPFTPNPEKIAFSSTRDGNSEVYVMNADGSGQERRTINSTADTDPALSPDGSKIAFASDRDGNFEIFAMNADGTNEIHLTNNGRDNRSPSFSPDGSKIVFSSNRDGNYEIYVMNSDGSNPTRLTDDLADLSPAFSPDGSQIVFASFVSGQTQSDIYIMNSDGSRKTQLTNDPANDQDPTFSPDGSKIAFTSFRDGNGEIYLMDANGSNQTDLTNDPSFDIIARFSPDGSKVAFSTNRDGDFEIYATNTDGSGGLKRLTTVPGLDAVYSYGNQADSDHDGHGDACDPNTAPLANADSYSLDEDTSISVSRPGVLANDSDHENAILAASLVTGPANAASFNFNADGSFSYSPAIHFFGTDSFTYNVSDGHLDSNVATVTINVTRPPKIEISALATQISQLRLDPGTKTSLNAKLKAALDALRFGNPAAACSDLQDFINEVNAQKGKKISFALADSLINQATQIQAQLGCGGVANANTDRSSSTVATLFGDIGLPPDDLALFINLEPMDMDPFKSKYPPGWRNF